MRLEDLRNIDTIDKAVGTDFHAQHCHGIPPVFLPADREASWLLLSSLISLLSGGTMQPENTYSCILKATSQVLGS